VSVTNHDEVSRLPTPTPQIPANPSSPKNYINWYSNAVPFYRKILITVKTNYRNTLNILCISSLSIAISKTKR